MSAPTGPAGAADRTLIALIADEVSCPNAAAHTHLVVLHVKPDYRSALPGCPSYLIRWVAPARWRRKRQRAGGYLEGVDPASV